MATPIAIDPIAGIYSIQYADPKFDPTTKIGEGTTGKRYASSYMGARSRWWDLAWKQAELEQKGVESHNRRVQQEILNLQDARANIIQGIPQRYDSMWKHNNTQEQKRLEWNAASGPMSSTTTTDRPAQHAALVGNRAKGSYYVRTDVQTLIQGAGNPNQTAGMLDAGRQSGVLGRDEQSQDQASYYAVQMQIEDLANNKLDAGASAANAWADAEAETLAAYDASGAGKDVVTRYRRVQAVAERDYGPQRTTSRTTRTGRDALDPYERTASILGIDPYDERHTIAQLDVEIGAKEAEIQPDIDLIGRTREVTSEKFGPGLIAGLFGGPQELTAAEQNLGRRDPRIVAPQRARAARALEAYFAGGGTVEELRRMGIMETPRDVRMAQAMEAEAQAQDATLVASQDDPDLPGREIVVGGNDPDSIIESIGIVGAWNNPEEKQVSFQLLDGTYMFYTESPATEGTVGGYQQGQMVIEGPGSWVINEVSEDGNVINKATWTTTASGETREVTDRATLDAVQGLVPKTDPEPARGPVIVSYHLAPDGRLVEYHRDDVEGAEWELVDDRQSPDKKEYNQVHGYEYVPQEPVTEKAAEPPVDPQPGDTDYMPEGMERQIIDMGEFDPGDPTAVSPSRQAELEDEAGIDREPILKPPWRGKDPIDMGDFDLGDPTAPTPPEDRPGGPTGSPGAEETTEEKPEKEESRIKKMLKEMQEATQVPSDVLGINAVPTLQEHRGNLLAGFTGAAELLEKPAALDRKTANADAGSPQEYARAVIDAETDKPVDQRSTLEEIVANVAQQYNGMGDIQGRDQALEYTIALYKLFLDSNTLTDQAGGGTRSA